VSVKVWFLQVFSLDLQVILGLLSILLVLSAKHVITMR